MVDYSEKRSEWLQKNCFNENESTFIYFGADSYDVKETLKECGFRFSKELLWHIAEIPSGYEDKVIEVKLTEVAEMTAWGQGLYIPSVKSIVEEKVKAARPVIIPTSEWIGVEKDKVTDLIVTLTSIHNFQNQFGYSQIVRFETEEGNIIKWFTATEIPFEIGSQLFLSGTIKSLTEDKYENNAQVTVMTRCKMREI